MTEDKKPDRMSPGQAAHAVIASQGASERSEQPTTPFGFMQKVKKLQQLRIVEPVYHYEPIRELMEETLRSLGYGEGIDLISKEREEEK